MKKKRLTKNATVFVRNLKKTGKYFFKTKEGYFIKFSNGSDGFFERKSFSVI